MNNRSRLTLEDIMPALNGLNKTVETTETEEPIGSEESLITLLDSVLNSKAEILPDLKLDFSDLPEFPNFYQFCYDPNWGIGQRPFSRQLAVALELLAEWCPTCSSKSLKDLSLIHI